MPSPKERRREPRVRHSGHPGARARPVLEVGLLDISTTGTRIEHREVLQPGSLCTLELPPVIGGLTVSARVVWSSIIGSEQPLEGEQRSPYQSGLEFVDVTPEQQADLERILEPLHLEEGLGAPPRGRVFTSEARGMPDLRGRNDACLPGENLGKRQYGRFPVSVPVLVRGPHSCGVETRGVVRNVGGGGLMAEFTLWILPGSAVRLVLQTQTGPLEADGRVLWTEATEGKVRHGVGFLEPREHEFAVDLFLHENRQPATDLLF